MKISVDIEVEVPEGNICKDGENFSCGHLRDQKCTLFSLGVWKTGKKTEFFDDERIYKNDKCFNKGD